MLVSCGGPDIRELPVTPNQHEALKKHAPDVKLDSILGGLEVLTATRGRARGSTHVQVLLEMAVVRLCRLGELLSVGNLIQALGQPGKQIVVPAAIPGTTAATRPAPPESGNTSSLAPGRSTANGPVTGQLPAQGGVTSPPIEAAAREALRYDRPRSPIEEASTSQLTQSTLPAVWDDFLQYMESKFPMLANHLKFVGSYAIFGPNALVIRFPSGYNLHYDACATGPAFRGFRIRSNSSLARQSRFASRWTQKPPRNRRR